MLGDESSMRVQSLSAVVALRIQKVRAERHLTQEQLAEAAGISRDALSRIERNDRAARLDTLAAIAEALGVEVRDLVAPKGRAGRAAQDPAQSLEVLALRSLRAMPPRVAKSMVRVLSIVARLK